MMNINELNPKAREAFGKSLVDTGVAIYKSLMILFTVIPIGVLLKASFENNKQPISAISMIENMTMATYWMLASFVIAAFVLAYYLRLTGLQHIHESEVSSLTEKNLSNIDK